MCERQPPPPLLFVKNPSRGILDNYINDEYVKLIYKCIVLNSRPHTIGLSGHKTQYNRDGELSHFSQPGE
jgi:hypothetical protein